MFTSSARFLLTLAASFALLLTMWVSAAHAAPQGYGCAPTEDGITMCDGRGFQLPEAPRGTVRRLPKVSTHRVNSVRGESTIDTKLGAGAMVGARVGVTTVVVRAGVRG